MMLMAAVLGGLPPMPEPKPKRKCLLAGCDTLTDHNGGYCCAEHHAEGKRPYRIALGADARDLQLVSTENPVSVPAGKTAVVNAFLMAPKNAVPTGVRTVLIHVTDPSGFEKAVPFQFLAPAGGTHAAP